MKLKQLIFEEVEKLLQEAPSLNYDLIENSLIEDVWSKKTTLKKSLSSKPTLVNFWADWCGPCKTEFIHIKNALQKNPNIEYIGISTTVGGGIGALPFQMVVERFKRVHNMPSSGKNFCAANDQLDVPNLPTNILYVNKKPIAVAGSFANEQAVIEFLNKANPQKVNQPQAAPAQPKPAVPTVPKKQPPEETPRSSPQPTPPAQPTSPAQPVKPAPTVNIQFKSGDRVFHEANPDITFIYIGPSSTKQGKVAVKDGAGKEFTVTPSRLRKR